jgi:hypothetical protein
MFYLNFLFNKSTAIYLSFSIPKSYRHLHLRLLIKFGNIKLGVVAQVVEYLVSKCEDLDSVPSTAGKKEKGKTKLHMGKT